MKSKWVEGEDYISTSPQAFREAVRQPFGELNSKPSPVPQYAIIDDTKMDDVTKKRHSDHMMAAHHKFMANMYRKKSHKK